MPIIFVLGSTASGKTQMSIGLSEYFNGIEIINCDSLQLWKGIETLSAAPTSEEKCIITHHLFSVITPFDQETENRNQIVWWLEETSKIVLDIIKRKKVPVFVGGTHYYALYFIEKIFGNYKENDEEKNYIQQYHPNDIRKNRNVEITTNLELGESTIKLQKTENIYPLILFMSAGSSLEQRAYNRIKMMINQNILTEVYNVLKNCPEERLIRAMRNEVLQDGKTDGALQAIGLKELSTIMRNGKYIYNIEEIKEVEQFLKQNLDAFPLTGFYDPSITQKFEKEKLTIDSHRLLDNNKMLLENAMKGLDKIYTNTIKYAKTQLKWKSQFEKRHIPLCSISSEGANSETFKELCIKPSYNFITQTIIKIDTINDKYYDKHEFCIHNSVKKEIIYCELCKVYLTKNSAEERIHFQSQRHKKAVLGAKKRSLKTFSNQLKKEDLNRN